MTDLYLFNEGTRAAIYGIGTYIAELTRCLKNKKDISLNIVQLNSEKKEFKIENETGCKIYYFPINNPFSYLFKKHPERYNKNVWFVLKQYIQKNQNEKLIFHFNYYQERTLISLIKASYPACETIFTVHYNDWAFKLNGNIGRFKKIIHTTETLLKDSDKDIYELYKKESTLFSEVDTVVCLGNYAKKILIEDYGILKNKIKVINNGLKDEGVILSASQHKKLKEKYFITEDEKIILFVGRLDEIKGVDVLIKAFKLVLKEYENCHLFIVGDGDMSKYQKETNEFWKKITFTGRLDKKDVYQLYKIADVGVVPSLYEPFGYVAIEMMMFNIPLIVTDTSGLGEIVEEGMNGWKIATKETDTGVKISSVSLKNRILDVLLNKYSIKEYNARDVFLRKFEVEQMKNKYLTLYK